MNEERDLLAAEYVLGTLDAAERGAASRLRDADREFDRAVSEWQQRLSPLANGIASVAPSDGQWRQIVAGLDSAAAERTDNVVRLRSSISRWRTATVGMGALAAGLALFAIDRSVLQTAPARQAGAYIAAINRGGDMPALIVRVDLATHVVTVRPVEADTPAGKSLELWYIAAGRTPVSMGVVGKGSERKAMPANMELVNTALAVTVEPSGGSPTGAPTGPIVYKGSLIAE